MLFASRPLILSVLLFLIPAISVDAHIRAVLKYMKNRSGCSQTCRSAQATSSRRAGVPTRLHMERLEPRTMLAVSVVPTVETSGTSGAADDIAIWIHPTDPSQSTVIGTEKSSSTSIRVYNLQGQPLQTVSVSNVNNIDLRYNFSLSGQSVAIVTGSSRSNDSIVIYKVDPQTRQLQNVAARTISTGISIYGCAMYVSPTTHKHYAFVTSESGQVQQWELFDNGAGKVDAKLVRSFSVGSQSEGMVADDVLGYLYVGEEDVGIWKYSAEPTGGSSRTHVDTTGSGGHVHADVEGLTIYYASNGTGYLIASSQGTNEFVVYRREGTNAFVGSFALTAGGGIDAVTDTDGIDVTNVSLGSAFPQGMFVSQDNDDNFKFARWDAIDAAFGGVLTTDTSWDPRRVGVVSQPNPLSGDYNRDHVVGTGDYVLWRKSQGSTGLPPYSGADGDGNGRVEAADYAIWRTQIGKVSASGAGASNMAMEEVTVTPVADLTADIQLVATPMQLSRTSSSPIDSTRSKTRSATSVSRVPAYLAAWQSLIWRDAETRSGELVCPFELATSAANIEEPLVEVKADTLYQSDEAFQLPFEQVAD